ncbi:6,7-dimethyl-8-ribityllumazine synthase [Candidatus Woesearchaeota archaeon]|nr:6,7-dimethyl-8-ribityllumazine synthase [Candidatus Woesearchaeota archaeon]
MKYKIAIVVSDFNKEITSLMEKSAEKTAESMNMEITKKVHVVIEGQTYHDIVIVNTVAQKLMELSLEYNKPLGFGIIGPRVTWQQAENRAEEYAKRAVKAALELRNH